MPIEIVLRVTDSNGVLIQLVRGADIDLCIVVGRDLRRLVGPSDRFSAVLATVIDHFLSNYPALSFRVRANVLGREFSRFEYEQLGDPFETLTLEFPVQRPTRFQRPPVISKYFK